MNNLSEAEIAAITQFLSSRLVKLRNIGIVEMYSRESNLWDAREDFPRHVYLCFERAFRNCGMFATCEQQLIYWVCVGVLLFDCVSEELLSAWKEMYFDFSKEYITSKLFETQQSFCRVVLSDCGHKFKKCIDEDNIPSLPDFV
jgi:hypothetical protein